MDCREHESPVLKADQCVCNSKVSRHCSQFSTSQLSTNQRRGSSYVATGRYRAVGCHTRTHVLARDISYIKHVMATTEDAGGGGTFGKEQRHVLFMHPQSAVVHDLRHFFPYGKHEAKYVCRTTKRLALCSMRAEYSCRNLSGIQGGKCYFQHVCIARQREPRQWRR